MVLISQGKQYPNRMHFDTDKALSWSKVVMHLDNIIAVFWTKVIKNFIIDIALFWSMHFASDKIQLWALFSNEAIMHFDVSIIK